LLYGLLFAPLAKNRKAPYRSLFLLRVGFPVYADCLGGVR